MTCASPAASFDQQPVEAAATIAACLAAARLTGDPRWRARLDAPSPGSLASNDLSQPLVDVETGSCRDGLHPDRRNENRGGESVLSYLLGLCRYSPRSTGETASRRRVARPGPDLYSFPVLVAHLSEVPLSQATFLNRQALYLRPDPARVIVRPFKPDDRARRTSVRTTRPAPTTSSTA